MSRAGTTSRPETGKGALLRGAPNGFAAGVTPFLIALLIAGCGGGDDEARLSKRDYERTVRAAVADAREAGGTPAALHAAGKRLRAVDPPAEVAGPHRDLAAAFDAIATAEERGVEPPDDVIDRLLAARRAFADRRYDIGVYGRL